MLPDLVRGTALAAEFVERTPAGALRFADQAHPGFMRQAVRLAGVARDAGTDDVFPLHRAAPVARQHVVEIQVAAVKPPGAILAGVVVAFEDVVAREADLLARKAIVDVEDDHLRHADRIGDRVDHLLFGPVAGKVAPTGEIVGGKPVLPLGGDDLALPLKKEDKGPADRGHVDGLPQSIQDQHLPVEK